MATSPPPPFPSRVHVQGAEGLTQQDAVPVDPPAEALLTVNAPHVLLLQRPDAVAAGASRVSLRSMRDFVGMEDADESTRRALMDFSFHMATGNMDEAYKAVKLVANPQIWHNMAQMCVKSKRLDVAAVCLGHMGHARGAKAVREGAVEPELEANVAEVAVQMGLLGDAARLYQTAKRYDKLNAMYQVRAHRALVQLVHACSALTALPSPVRTHRAVDSGTGRWRWLPSTTGCT